MSNPKLKPEQALSIMAGAAGASELPRYDDAQKKVVPSFKKNSLSSKERKAKKLERKRVKKARRRNR